MRPEDFLSLRLSNQGLSISTAEDSREVVSGLGAVQGQDYAGALWSIGLRIPGSVQADVVKSIAERKIVRTWPMRGTLHYVAAEDAHWMVGLLAPRVAARNATRLLRMGVGEDEVAQARKLVSGMLDGTEMTREEVYLGLASGGVPVTKGRGLQLLWRLAHEGLVCFGARRGRQPTFVLLDQWVPEAKRNQPDNPLSELAKRYFASHGPASLRDFVWWTGLKASEGRAAVRSAEADLEKVTVGDAEYWMSFRGGTSGALEDAYLLPVFDEYVIAYKDREAIIDTQFVEWKIGGRPALFAPKVILEGKAVGTWKRVLKRDEVKVSLDLFRRLSKEKREAVDRAVERYGRFLGKKVAP